MSNFQTPGVYVEEIATLPASIAGVATGIPAFVGYVQKSERAGVGIPMFTPVRITSLLEYREVFGAADPQPFEIEIVDDTTVTPTTRQITVTKQDESIFRMYYNVEMYFANGGGPCWVVPTGVYSLANLLAVPVINKTALISGLTALEKISEPTLLVFPDAVSLTDLSDIKEVYEAALDQCNTLKNRFTIMDVKQSEPANVMDDADDFRNETIGVDFLKYGATYYPYLNTTLNFGINGLLLQVNEYTITGGVPPTPVGFVEARDFTIDVSTAIQGTLDALSYLKIATKTLTALDAGNVETLVAGVQASVTSALDVTFPVPTPPIINPFIVIQNPLLDGINDVQMDAVVTAADNFANPIPPATPSASDANALKLALQDLLTALQGVMGDITDAYNDDYTDFIGGNLNYLQGNQPSIFTEVISAINGHRVTVNPSGTMAGIYARVDNSRGVWQAPANVGVRNVIGPSVLITNEQQGTLNVDALSGKSINAIRTFTGRGTLVWGARTLDGNSNEWRYINVRRLFIYLEESIKRASQFVVFEPNDANTWVTVKGSITNFLTTVWKDGGLFGATTQEAFFVNVGLGTSMTSVDILEGRMIIEVGVAAVRPAEFIILRFVHNIQES